MVTGKFLKKMNPGILIHPLTGLYYYFIAALDIHGNYSPVAVTQAPSTSLDLTMFIEGFYDAGSNMQVSDSVSVELRNSISPYAIAGQTKGVVKSEGMVRLYFGNIASGNYYITVSHRNSISTWSANSILIISGGLNSYDLSTANTQAYGNNLTRVDLSPVRFAIYSGDENQNGIVDLSDVVNVSNAAGSFTTGYVPTDMNGDGVVDLSDMVITSNNASAFISKIVP